MAMRLGDTLSDLRRRDHLVEVTEKVDPYLEMASIQRRVFQAGGPALFFSNIKGCRFPAVSNLFGTLERGKYLLRRGYDCLELLLRWQEKGFISAFSDLSWRNRFRLSSQAFSFVPKRLSRRTRRKKLAQYQRCRIQDLPQIQSWPKDGGSFILLPQVYSADPRKTQKIQGSNLGMYRIQMNGGDYEQDKEIGLHYQTHRGIGLHQMMALEEGKPLPVSIFVGGPPAHIFSAVFPAPEFIPEVCLAGLLNCERFRYLFDDLGFFCSTEADFCIFGIVGAGTRNEGPFGDHLGYYSLQHPFPYVNVSRVCHLPDPIWPFTIVGRPPQEDTVLGSIIHELTAPLISKVLPGVRAIHAVDESGVHPLLLAIGRESYTPYAKNDRPQEILTLAHKILGFGQLSLAKYLMIMSDDNSTENLNIADISTFFSNFLSRTRLERDLHFMTKTNMDTLDYSGGNFNQGSKLIWAAASQPIRELLHKKDFQKKRQSNSPIAEFLRRNDGHWIIQGIMGISIDPFSSYEKAEQELDALIGRIELTIANGCADFWKRMPVLILSEISERLASNFREFLWVAFTRSNPAADIYGAHATIRHKHWSCVEPLIIDARLKPHHSPPLEEDQEVEDRVNHLGKKGASLHGII